GAELLRLCSVKGSQEELREVSRAVQGHALTMTLLGNYIADALDGDVRRWREVPLGATETRPGERAQHVMEAYDRWFEPGPERAILRIVGLFDRPASAGCIAALRKEPAIRGLTDALVALTDTKWKLAVNRLSRTGLLAPTGKSDDGSLDAHPLVRECFGTMLERENPQGYRAAHRRLYEYLRDTTPELPDTFDGLQPLYQAVSHGCRAGQHEEALDGVFYPRIRRYDQHYSVTVLGAFGADLATLAGFFEGDWRRPVASLTEATRSFVLSEAAFSLRALGRLREAGAPLKSSLDMCVALSHWVNAANAASNLAQLHASSGALHEALSMAKRTVELADRAGKDEWPWRVLSRCTLANVFCHLGNPENARLLFEEAERMQIKQQPQLPLLYALQGRQFCELLLDLGEPREVERRATQTLVWMRKERWLLDIAHDHLSLGCALGMLEQRENARPHFTQAIDMLRGAGALEFLASSLVLRAAFLREAGDRDSARRDTDEALGLARRSELRLVECDACLEQARLALDANDPAAARAAFESARSLVDKCEYHRRDCELALIEARLALADGNRTAAQVAYERARAVATAEKLRACDKELAAVAAAVV
ncbi:MAG: tetratricopeptide repeat protein, partial [Hyalangium sp.]|uniref:tetratricopeptide repeat protein n=1 Tax=Hyalangium sp. TaxID=2028555 RepID=UPI00389B0E4B